MVDVTGVDRDRLLLGLWTNSKPAAFFQNMPHMAPSFNLDDAKREMYSTGYIEYACGRLIKARVYGESNVIDPILYDREYGEGAFARVVASLK